MSSIKDTEGLLAAYRALIRCAFHSLYRTMRTKIMSTHSDDRIYKILAADETSEWQVFFVTVDGVLIIVIIIVIINFLFCAIITKCSYTIF